MRKYQRAIAHNLMQLDGVPRINKRIPGTRVSIPRLPFLRFMGYSGEIAE